MRQHLTLFLAGWAVLAGCLGGSRAAAQSLIAEDPKDLYHWAYAAAFGTGAYRIGDTDQYSVRIYPKYVLSRFNQDRFSLNLRLPFTVGLQSIDMDDIVNTPVSEQFATLSFVPGLGFYLPLHPRWRLNPYINYGWGTEVQGETSAWIYFAGLNSRFLIHLKHLDIVVLNGVQWLGHNPDTAPEERFARLFNGLEINLPLWDWELEEHRLVLKPHVVHYWYFDQLNLSIVQERPVELNQEVEVALAIGVQEQVSFWVFKFDRLGIGYRKGDEIEGFRLFFDSVFD